MSIWLLLLALQLKNKSFFKDLGSSDNRPKQLSPGELLARSSMRSRANQDALSSKKKKAKRFSAMDGKVGGNQMKVLDIRISSTTSDVPNKISPSR
jgi:hypothetical protein